MSERKPVYIICDDPAPKDKVVFGNEFDPERGNTAESEIGKTTRVTRYPNGISPSGCYDMAGNAWEWTSSWYDDENTHRVLRGGSWDIN